MQNPMKDIQISTCHALKFLSSQGPGYLILPSVCRKTFALRKTVAPIFALLRLVQVRQILQFHLWRAKKKGEALNKDKKPWCLK